MRRKTASGIKHTKEANSKRRKDEELAYIEQIKNQYNFERAQREQELSQNNKVMMELERKEEELLDQLQQTRQREQAAQSELGDCAGLFSMSSKADLNRSMAVESHGLDFNSKRGYKSGVNNTLNDMILGKDDESVTSKDRMFTPAKKTVSKTPARSATAKADPQKSVKASI